MTPHLLEDLPTLLDEVASATSLLLALDFDGTLSPIVPTPEEARILPASSRALEHLRLMNDPSLTVAIVTGRAVADVSTRIPVVDWVIGLHGLEVRGPDGTLRRRVDTSTSDAAMERLRDVTVAIAAASGARVEDKGRFIALHVRGLPTEIGERALADFETRVEQESAAGAPVECLRGKAVAEARPVGVSKAGALAELTALLGNPALLYVGDDTTDEDVFRDRPDALTVVVLDHERPTAARTALRSPDEVATLLREIGLRRTRRLPGD